MAQVGVGDPTQGVSYTLASVTAVVLGGTSIFGGRGSFIGALFGAILVEQLLNVTTFLQLSQAWQYWFEGVLVMVAVGIYTQARSRPGGLAQVTAVAALSQRHTDSREGGNRACAHWSSRRPARRRSPTRSAPRPAPARSWSAHAWSACATPTWSCSPGRYIIPISYPITPGHEWAGEVAETGPGVTTSSRATRWSASAWSGPGGRDHFGFSISGAAAEYFMARAEWLHKLPPQLTFTQGALVEPFSVAYAAVRAAVIDPSDRVAVLGGGPIGLLTAMAAAGRNAAVTVIEPRPDRRAKAIDVGVPATIDPAAGRPGRAGQGAHRRRAVRRGHRVGRPSGGDGPGADDRRQSRPDRLRGHRRRQHGPGGTRPDPGPVAAHPGHRRLGGHLAAGDPVPGDRRGGPDPDRHRPVPARTRPRRRSRRPPGLGQHQGAHRGRRREGRRLPRAPATSGSSRWPSRARPVPASCSSGCPGRRCAAPTPPSGTTGRCSPGRRWCSATSSPAGRRRGRRAWPASRPGPGWSAGPGSPAGLRVVRRGPDQPVRQLPDPRPAPRRRPGRVRPLARRHLPAGARRARRHRRRDGPAARRRAARRAARPGRAGPVLRGDRRRRHRLVRRRRRGGARRRPADRRRRRRRPARHRGRARRDQHGERRAPGRRWPPSWPPPAAGRARGDRGVRGPGQPGRGAAHGPPGRRRRDRRPAGRPAGRRPVLACRSARSTCTAPWPTCAARTWPRRSPLLAGSPLAQTVLGDVIRLGDLVEGGLRPLAERKAHGKIVVDVQGSA